MATFSGRSEKAASIRDLNGSNRDDNGGTSPYIAPINYPGNTIVNSAVEWDVSSIAGSNADADGSITLFYYNYLTNTPTINSYKLKREWGEGTKNWAAASAGEITWNSAQHGSVSWTGGGASDTTNDINATPEDSNTLTVEEDYVSTVTQATLQEWLDGTNYGVIFRATDGNANSQVYFHSDDATGTTSDPLLEFTYSEAATGGPPVGMMMGVGT